MVPKRKDTYMDVSDSVENQHDEKIDKPGRRVPHANAASLFFGLPP